MRPLRQNNSREEENHRMHYKGCRGRVLGVAVVYGYFRQLHSRTWKPHAKKSNLPSPENQRNKAIDEVKLRNSVPQQFFYIQSNGFGAVGVEILSSADCLPAAV